MIYINGQKASKKDFEKLRKWTKAGKTIAKAKTDKSGNLQIVTKD